MTTDYQTASTEYARTLARLDMVKGFRQREDREVHHLIWSHLIALSGGQGDRADGILLDGFIATHAVPAYHSRFRQDAAGARAQIANREEPHWRRQPRGGFQRPSGEL